MMLHANYLKWYVNSEAYKSVTFMGVPCRKSYADLWQYQEIIFALKPSVVIEFGVRFGGSLLYYKRMADLVRPIEPVQAFGVDVTANALHPSVIDAGVTVYTCASTDARVAAYINAIRAACPGPAFISLDSDHSRKNVLAELKMLRPLTQPGDYVVVEDGWQFQDGPIQAIREYEAELPKDYKHDTWRETRFGWTFAPYGFLVRQ